MMPEPTTVARRKAVPTPRRSRGVPDQPASRARRRWSATGGRLGGGLAGEADGRAARSSHPPSLPESVGLHHSSSWHRPSCCRILDPDLCPVPRQWHAVFSPCDRSGGPRPRTGLWFDRRLLVCRDLAERRNGWRGSPWSGGASCNREVCQRGTQLIDRTWNSRVGAWSP